MFEVVIRSLSLLPCKVLVIDQATGEGWIGRTKNFVLSTAGSLLNMNRQAAWDSEPSTQPLSTLKKEERLTKLYRNSSSKQVRESTSNLPRVT